MSLLLPFVVVCTACMLHSFESFIGLPYKAIVCVILSKRRNPWRLFQKHEPVNSNVRFTFGYRTSTIYETSIQKRAYMHQACAFFSRLRSLMAIVLRHHLSRRGIISCIFRLQDRFPVVWSCAMFLLTRVILNLGLLNEVNSGLCAYFG